MYFGYTKYSTKDANDWNAAVYSATDKMISRYFFVGLGRMEYGFIPRFNRHFELKVIMGAGEEQW